MIEPAISGAALIARIEGETPPPGVLFIWWLGQSGYLIKSAQGLLAIDLYLSEHLTQKYAGTGREHVRMTRAPLRAADLVGIDLVLASHRHSDHFDPGSLPELMAGSHARLAFPEAIRDHALALDLPQDRLIGLCAGDVIEHAGFRVRTIPSAHEGLDTDPLGRHLYLGFVIETEGLALYHSGDTLAYPGLEDALGKGPFDVLLLPINGRDPARGVPGNMTAAEAATLASRVRPRYVVPHHYDMFTFNTVPIADFVREAQRLPAETLARVLECGGRWEVAR